MSSADELAFERYEFYKKRLQAILKKKNPKKIKAIDGLLSKYRGREHGVYVKVCAKYGITPKSEWKPKGKQQPKKEKIKAKIKQNLKQIKKQKIANKAAAKLKTKQKTMNSKLLALKNPKINKTTIAKIKQHIIKKPIPSKKESPESEEEYDDDFEV